MHCCRNVIFRHNFSVKIEDNIFQCGSSKYWLEGVVRDVDWGFFYDNRANCDVGDEYTFYIDSAAVIRINGNRRRGQFSEDFGGAAFFVYNGDL